jgi:hypothetical protein
MNKIYELLGNLFDDNSLGVQAHQHHNGADWLQCPACYATKDVMGHAFGQYPLMDIDHLQSCELVALYNLLQEERNKS